MNRVMPDLDKVFFISPVKVWFHAFCISHFMLKKPSKILLAPVKKWMLCFLQCKSQYICTAKRKAMSDSQPYFSLIVIPFGLKFATVRL